MKRRTADCGKLRRPLKRNKITEGFYGSTFVYVKFLMVWAAVLMADFILQFRFEYLWPFWLLVRSVYDSFKYQGLAFSVFFVCIAVTSDIVCYLFIPVQWLFFAASTYVWVQYVWHTDRGICLPTVSLWLLFVYIEASIRLREFKNFPFNLDLCRPFAAHCIGYPVVTLGFGFKSYVSYRFRLRKQKEVEKENEFYYQLLQQALPIEQQNLEKQKALAASKEDTISSTPPNTSTVQNGAVPSAVAEQTATSTPATTESKKSASNVSRSSSVVEQQPSNNTQKQKDLKQKQQDKQNNSSSNTNSPHIEDIQYIENPLPPPKKHNVNDFRGDPNETSVENERNASKVLHKQQNGLGGKHGKLNTAKETNASQSSSSSSKKGKNNNAAATVYSNNKDEVISSMKEIGFWLKPAGTSPINIMAGSDLEQKIMAAQHIKERIKKLEADVRRHKADLHGSRSAEQELRSQINNLVMCERNTKEELAKLREDNENLQNKLHKLVTGRQQDKETVGALEKRLADEKKQKAQFEQQLSAEKKAKKEQEAAAASALANATRTECTDKCKLHVRELETDLKQARRETQLREEQIQQLERETQMLRKYKDAKSENDLLMSALGAMQEKNAHLENSLSAENRLKQDLFSALGEAKRQIEIQQGLLAQKEHAIANLKAKVAEVMALLPAAASGFGAMVVSASPEAPLAFSGSYTPPSTGSHTPPQGDAFTPPPQAQPSGPEEDVLASSSLNPMASDYTPSSKH